MQFTAYASAACLLISNLQPQVLNCFSGIALLYADFTDFQYVTVMTNVAVLSHCAQKFVIKF